MDLERLEIIIRKNLITDFNDGNSIGISFPNNKRVKLLNRTEDLSIVVEFDNLKLLEEKNLLYCEVKNNIFYNLNTINIMYKCVREAVKYLIKSEKEEFKF